ncbi:hypothetical protein Ga0074812_13172 [Parafrankia irregularis]|uniref:Anti-sigma regulatory factor (Ser/Thr protein kinase) n=1 Tax=Parafrankia irregularis TaxID=795642 RepID=A0A0S4QXZ7_9ACTN|nr:MULTISPECIES: ATP-binding protein [Parafrankia]MBE3200344.1 ATP-binding protein [Parafrankia sp. CH37]CUU59772.1 hypothetical protein Ga0074812_13172 [Parafrankia irregularis]
MTHRSNTDPPKRAVDPCFVRQRVFRHPADRHAIGDAGQNVIAQLRLWGLAELTDTAVLVLSELATSAVLASRGSHRRAGDQTVSWFAVRLNYRRNDLIIEVWDRTLEDPIPRGTEATRDRGFDFPIVAALAGDWGRYAPLTRGIGDSRMAVTWGRVVWAALRHDRPPFPENTRLARPCDLPRRSPPPVVATGAPSDPALVDSLLLQRTVDRLRVLG